MVASKFFVFKHLKASTLFTNCDLMSLTNLKILSCCVSAASSASKCSDVLTVATASAEEESLEPCVAPRRPATGEARLPSGVGVTLELALAELGADDDPDEVGGMEGGETSLVLLVEDSPLEDAAELLVLLVLREG
jgi:hypothetical protein